MFLDYYAILEVDENASLQEIKIAFKKQALKWHPDKNLAQNTTQRMQEINEAYLFLKDIEARARYDNEYSLFKKFKKEQYHHNKEKQPKYDEAEQTHTYTDYQSSDDVLNNWMNNAKKQAIDLAKQTIQDFKGMVSVGVKAAAEEAAKRLIAQIAVSVIFFVIIVLANSCNN